MKQINRILQFAILVTLFSGCDKQTLITTEGLLRDEIGFSVASQNTKSNNDTTIVNNSYVVEVKEMQNNTHTKGAILTNGTITDFGAFGYSTGNGNWTAVAIPGIFHDKEVLSSSEWNTKRLWEDGNNSFFAYAPYKTETNGITVVSTETAAGVPIIKYVMAEAAANQPDILVAEPALDKIRPAGDNEGVLMNFKHKLAAIGFRVENAYETTISNITVTGIKSEGTLKIDNGAETTWDTSMQADVSNLTYTAGVNTAVNGGLSGYINEKELMLANGYLMMIPQTLGNDAVLTVYLDKNGAKSSVVFQMSEFMPAVEGDKHYTLVIKLQSPPPPPTDHTTKPANCFVVQPGESIKFNAKLIGTKPSNVADMQTFNPNIGQIPGYGDRKSTRLNSSH